MNHYRTLFITCLWVVLAAVAALPAQAGGVVGNGTPASCTENALRNRINNGGLVTFNCGSNPVTITITQELFFQDYNTTIDGGNKVILKGSPGVRIIHFRTWGNIGSRTLTLRNLTIRDASRTGDRENANGAAVYVRSQSANFEEDIPTLNVENVRFINNRSTQTNNSGNPYDFGGGAIYILGGILNVTDSTFTNNRSDGGAGAAIHVLGSNLNVTDSTFNNNTSTPTSPSNRNAGLAGAIYVDGSLFRGNGAVRITGSTFEGNAAANQGGAAYINLYNSRNSELVIDSSQFINNTVSGGAMGLGGAISGGGTGGAVDVTITNSFFSGNQVSDSSGGASGGALAFAQAANIFIANSAFTQNRANGACSSCTNANGGAIYVVNNPTPFEIVNSTIFNNYAGWVGGGITGSPGVLRNTILAKNTAENGGNGWEIQQHCSAELTNGGNNIQYPDRNPNPNYWNEIVCAPGIRIVAPQVRPAEMAANGMYHLPLMNTSPAINAGSNQAAINAGLTQDQVGNARIQQGVVDVGAFETDVLPEDVDPNTLPRITATTPGDGVNNIAVDSNVTLTTSEPLRGSASAVRFTCNNERVRFKLTAPGGIYTFNPNADLPADATCTLALTTSEITDRSGNALVDDDGNNDGIYRLTFSTVPQPPTMVSTSPGNGASGVLVEANILLTFSEPVTINPNGVSFSCQPDGPSGMGVNINGNTYTLNPNGDLPLSSTCTLAIPVANVEDATGNTLIDGDGNNDGTYTLTFSTEEAPEIVSISPANNAENVSVDSALVLTFSESVRLFNGRSTSFVCQPGTWRTGFTVQRSGNTLTATPKRQLPYEAECTLQIPLDVVRDSDGNYLLDTDGTSDGVYTLVFNTASVEAVTEVIVPATDETEPAITATEESTTLEQIQIVPGGE